MKIKTILPILALGLWSATAMAGDLDISDGGWSIAFNTSSKTLSLTQNGTALLKNVFARVLNAGEETLETTQYPDVALKKEAYTDALGTCVKYTYTYSGLSGKDNIEQIFYIYPDRGYLLVEADLVANSGTAKTHYIAPIVVTKSNTFLPSGGDNRIYDMPHDNDNWVGYSAQPWNIGQPNTSCEVSAFYDVISRAGLVVGSIEHDNWKSGITATPGGSNRLRNLTVAAGVVGKRTNDVWDGRPSISVHGSISGQRVRSPRYFFGYYADWRTGLEQLGEATEKLCPKLPWKGGTIFAWQSWGGMAEKVNYEGAVDVSDFFHDTLMPANFHNENGTCYMVLDSYWSNLTEEQLARFVEHCRANGQHPGVYTTPFSYWGSESDAAKYRPYDGSPWTWADMSLKAGGQLRKISSIALDPTHPGTIEWNRQRFEMFRRLGFEYVKLDFINNGTLEADSYYADGVTTGMQAYSRGMDSIIAMAGDMFIDLSIAPVFPAKGHARRISCDCWGELNNSQYSLNSIGMGWWLDRVYQYNDPDHLVLSRAENEGAARIRYTCGMMTGTVLLGDNYSLKGTCLGKQSERDLAVKVATNADINAVARIGRSFRTVEGSMDTQFTRYQYTYGVDNEFVLDTDDALYYVVFNYDKDNALTKQADFNRIGISPADVKGITELWTGEKISFSGNGFGAAVPECDVRVYRLEKASWSSGISAVRSDNGGIRASYGNGSLHVEASGAVASVAVYDMAGRLRVSSRPEGSARQITIDGHSLGKGAYIVSVTTRGGKGGRIKFFVL